MFAYASLLVLATFAAGCASAPAPESSAKSAPSCADCPFAGLSDAVAAVNPTKGNAVHGVVRFTQTADGVRVVADIEGLKPNAKHAFHVHEFGDATGADGKTAGGHYNPDNHPHAGPDAAMRHAGDLGNLETDATGTAHYDRVISGISIACGHAPVVGRSVVIHASEDDLSTQPAGNAGDRIAVGVIGVAKPAAK
jgi:Cu-Zn family superoxide dismutase